MKRESLCTVGRNVIGAIGNVIVENTTEVPQEIKNRTTIWSSDSTSWYLFEGNENTNSERYMNPHVYCSIIYNSQDMETT